MRSRQNALTSAYFNWLVDIACYDQYRTAKRTYSKLLRYLFERDFDVFIIEADINRAADGVKLRSQFGDEMSYTDETVNRYLTGSCSILEMMVALSLRCEIHIMCNSSIGDRTGRWFWEMISNLGLNDSTDYQYDKKYVEAVIDALINRDYKPNGKGGLFLIENSRQDQRGVEIWYQMCGYMNNILNEETD